MDGWNTVRERVRHLVDAAVAGDGGALVVRLPRTRDAPDLLGEAASRFTGRVLQVRGVAAEQGVPFAGLHALLQPVADLTRSDPEYAPLASALRLPATLPPTDGCPGPVLVATLALVQQLAAERPLLCCVWDAAHLDAASLHALGFVARRLGEGAGAALLLETGAAVGGQPYAGARELATRSRRAAGGKGVTTSTTVRGTGVRTGVVASRGRFGPVAGVPGVPSARGSSSAVVGELRGAGLGGPSDRPPLDGGGVVASSVPSDAPHRTRGTVAGLTAAPRSAALAPSTDRTGAGPQADTALVDDVPHALAGLPLSEPVPGVDELLGGMDELAAGPLADARAQLDEAARLVRPYAPELAAEALLHAAEASFGLGDEAGYLGAIGALRELPAAGEDALLDAYTAGMFALLRGRVGEGIPALRRCLPLARHELRAERLLLCAGAALVLGEVGSARALGTRTLAAARARGPRALLPWALERLAYGELRAGRHDRAGRHAAAGLRVAAETGQRNRAAHLHAVSAMAAAVRGDAAECAAHARAAGADAGPHGLSVAWTLAQWALGRCDLLHARASEAALRLGPLVRGGPGPTGSAQENRSGQGHFTQRMLALPCYVEAAVLAGEQTAARAALDDFVLWTAATADPLAPAQLARCRALLAEPDVAEGYFRTALDEHTRSDNEFERARTQLHYGALLRRQRRPRQAREVLSAALLVFERGPARPLAERARAELRAAGARECAAPSAGVTSPRPRPTPRAELDPAALTPQQLRVARRVAQGATNREVATELSVSPRTVDHHLRNVFAALGVRSRVELSVLLAPGEEDEVD